MTTLDFQDAKTQELAKHPAIVGLAPEEKVALGVMLQRQVQDTELRKLGATEAFAGLSPDDQVDVAAANVQNLTSTQQEEVQNRVGPPVAPGSERHRYALWMTLLVILGVLALAAGTAAYFLAANGKDVAAFIGLATAAVGGLIGIFSTSPTNSSAQRAG